MLFNSFEFLPFLGVVLLVYFALGTRAQNAFLVGASYFFYGWWDWRFCALLLGSTVLDYHCALGIESAERSRKRFLYLSLAGNLGVLFFFKYADFFVDSMAELLSAVGFEAHLPTLRIILPVGISFYTFQTMGYTIDVYRGRVKACRSPIVYALYVAFFPQLVAGPIERAGSLLKQFTERRKPDLERMTSGFFLMGLGFFKKIAIADGVQPTVDRIFESYGLYDGITLWAGAWLFAIQIYCDFSGYSDIARGVARVLGIDLMVNFNQPYFASSITDFWRRWHISLSTWLRDYLYIPLGGSRVGEWKTYRNLMLTMLLGGLWHGANWTFVAWGGLHGLYLSVHKLLLGRTKETSQTATGRLLRGLGVFHLVLVAWVLFRSPDLSTALDYLWRILTSVNLGDLPLTVVAQVAFFSGLTLFLDLPQSRTGRHEAMLDWRWPLRGLSYAAMVLLGIVLSPDGEIAFIYFQF